MKNKLRIILLLLLLCPQINVSGQNTLATLADMHSVVKGETWESIAAHYGVSVAELQAANPDVKRKKLKKKTLLIIPKAHAPLASEGKESSLPAGQIELTPLIRTSIPNLKVGVLLPFGQPKMVEFYRGLLMAADSVRRQGVNLDIHAWDCGTTTAQLEPLLPGLSGLDVIFGPPSPTQIHVLAETCREQGTRLVLPFWSGQALQDYPLVYNATAPDAVCCDAAVRKLLSYYADRNFVIVHSGNADNIGRTLTEVLGQHVTQRAVVSRVLELEGDDFAYESALNQFRDNMIVIDDSSVRSLNILMARLKEFRQKHPDYRLTLVGYSSWQDETQRLLGDFFAFDTHVISPYYYNVFDERTKLFQRTYEKAFRTTIAQDNPRLAAMGFDLGYYFMSGISSLGDTFEQMQGSLRQESYQNRYQFERSATGMSFTNSFIQFIHFTPENKIELIR